jgi:anion transporter
MIAHSSTGNGRSARSTLLYRWAVVLLVPAALMLIQVPAGVTPPGWRLFAIFVGTILGLILQPLPLGAMALIGVAAASMSGALPPGQALSGYAEPLVWMVLAAFCISRGMIKTGLGRRIALWFIRAIGHSSIGLGYSVVASDTLLGMVVPSNGARVGGIIFPIVKSLAEAYESTPGPTAGRLGAFLMLMVYHCDMTVSAMFFTGNAANPLIVSLAKQVTGIEVSYTRWAVGAIVPALASMAVVPMVLWRVRPPSVRRTPAAAAFASAELNRLTSTVSPGTTRMWITAGVLSRVLVLAPAGSETMEARSRLSGWRYARRTPSFTISSTLRSASHCTRIPIVRKTTTMPVSWQIGRWPSAHILELVRICAMASRAAGEASCLWASPRASR